MLVLKDVHKTFNRGSANEKIALKGITLSVNEGDFITVIGGNGAGKSTMLNMISGAFPVDSGMIKIGGENVTNQPEHIRAKRIGRVFQDPMRGTAGDMWIEENLAIAVRRGKRRGLRWGVTKEERELFKELLSPFDLGLERQQNVCHADCVIHILPFLVRILNCNFGHKGSLSHLRTG